MAMGKLSLALGLCVLAIAAGCRDGSKKNVVMRQRPGAVAVTDSTVYGTCGLGTAMNTLELITDGGDTLELSINAAKEHGNVKGGLAVGDRMAVVMSRSRGATGVADNVVNISSLLGRWARIGEMFEICDSGIVKSTLKEPKPYTEWQIFNGKLVLSTDTFGIMSIGHDSLFLVKDGVTFGYRRLPGSIGTGTE